MNRPLAPLFLILVCGLSGCASTSSGTPNTVAVPDEEARQLALREAEARRRDFRNVLLKLDQSMESYARAFANRGVARADIQREQLEKLIHDLVLDQGTKTFIKDTHASGASGIVRTWADLLK